MATARRQVADAIRTYIDDATEHSGHVSISDIRLYIKNLLAHDDVFLRNYWAESSDILIIEQARNILASTRNTITVDPEPTPPGKPPKVSVFFQWRENIGEGRYLKLRDMTRSELDIAITRGRAQITARTRLLNFREALRAGMQGDTDIVGQRYTIEQMQELAHQHGLKVD